MRRGRPKSKEIVSLVPVHAEADLSQEISALVQYPDLAEKAKNYAKSARSQATQKAFKADWKVFSEWCAKKRLQALPASVETAIAFFTDQAETKKAATLTRYKATLSKTHIMRGFKSPFSDERVDIVLEGIRKNNGVKQDQKAAATLEFVSSPTDNDLVGIRDRAVMLLGFVTAFRRSEVSAIDVEHLRFVDEGLIVYLPKSKTDQEGKGRHVPVPSIDDDTTRCAVTAVRAWLEASGIKHGPLFQSVRGKSLTGRRLPPKGVADIIKATAIAKGEDPTKYAGHSLRAGFITWAWEAGFSIPEIMEQSGHTRTETVRRYIRSSGQVNPFKRNKIMAIMAEIRKLNT